MNNKGSFKVFLIVVLVIVVLLGILFGISHFTNKGEISCPKTPEDQITLRIPLQGVMAGGKQTGAETHKFVNGESVSVCCADVKSADGRDFKDCIHYTEEGKQDYQVVWEKKNGVLNKIKEDLPWQGSQCIYNFDGSGEWSGRYCYDPNEQIATETQPSTNQKDNQQVPDTPKSYYDTLTTPYSECDNLQYDSDKEKCYKEKAIEKKDISICDYIKPKESWSYYSARDNCYYEVAYRIPDITICDKISDDSQIAEQKDRCYITLVNYLSSVSDCDNKIQTQKMKNACYKHFACRNNDNSLCDNIIGDEVNKESCIKFEFC